MTTVLFQVEDSRCYWHNFQTKQTEYREAPTTDDDARTLLPQHPSAQALYGIYREMGKDILDAMAAVLEACLGQPSRDSSTQEAQ